MAKILVRRSYVDMIGLIWMPPVMCSMRKELDSHDIESIRGYSEVVSETPVQLWGPHIQRITREGLEHWLLLNSGDFQSVTDFSASIEDGYFTTEFPWENEESGLIFSDCQGYDI